MAKIDQPVINPRSTASGRGVNVAVAYSAGEDDTLLIESSPGFSHTPPSFPLPTAAAGSVAFVLTVTRDAGSNAPPSCRLTFTTTGSERVDRIEVR
jgi:hypothetical protein